MGSSTGEKRNVLKILDGIDERWSPHVVGESNDYDVKVANVAGEFVERAHPDTDEIFLVIAGRLFLDLPDRTVTLDQMDLFTVPRGVRHRPSRTRHPHPDVGAARNIAGRNRVGDNGRSDSKVKSSMRDRPYLASRTRRAPVMWGVRVRCLLVLRARP